MRGQFDGEQVLLENALPFLLHACYQQLRSLTYREFSAHGLELTPEQWIVLVRLWQLDGQSQAALGASTFRDAPTMSRILGTMERSGLIRRSVDEHDARAHKVTLTAAAKALRPKLIPLAKRLVAQLEREIPEHDLVVTHRTLSRMLQNVS